MNGYGQRQAEAGKMEKLIAGVVAKAMPSSVYLIEWDTVKNAVKEGMMESQGFTGVVVSAEGHILTASHAAVTGEVYQVRFPDGSRHIATGLGRLGIQVGETDHDMAMLKINRPGKWPFAEMGRVADIQLHQPVISISYPGSFYKATPNVRFGRLTDVDQSDGFLASTAKMEPGDSGGPLFDALGRVIGIHSWIKEDEGINFDVPVYFFLKYWTAINQPIDYKELPAAEMVVPILPVIIPMVPALDEVAVLSPQQRNSAVTVSSKRGPKEITIQGTVVQLGHSTRIVSKSSMVASEPWIQLNGKTITLTVVARDREQDLVLLTTTEKLQGAILLKGNEQDLTADLGKILISAVSSKAQKAGIVSAAYIDMPLNSSPGFCGASAVYADGKITFSQVSPGATVLKPQDQVVKINEVAIFQAADYDREMAKYMAGDSITLDLVREGNPVKVNVFLSGQPTVRHVSFDYPGGRSARSDGFKRVLVQDAAIRADECGGPVFDIEGRFGGINIARHSRTASIVMPVSAIVNFIKNNPS